MTSSMLSGERRWASARRGGMTVLGKVSVPKPINLPSQKLENHGLDPNVEIVPKGMLSWGSRSSSSASNAWGSSTLSPNADGGIDSTSHVSGCPSSGGSGTRPSTGNSEKAHEPIVSAWSSNSRPSSASGALTSSQTSAISLRPQSAETRPASSQLSRFAESLSENSVAWDTAGTAEKLGVASSQNDGFALTSGDFPTLGSEKDNAGRNTESQDLGSHGQPGSSSGGVAPVKDRTGTSVAGDVSVNANVRSGTENSWRRDNNPYGEEGARSSVEKWQADPQGTQPYPTTGIPHQHFEVWHGPHGPPITNHAGGVWYRGPPGGPPFGSPVPPGGFPVETFPFYRPQIPVTALANPPPVHPPGAGPRVHHPKHGDLYRPPMPDAYMHPSIPIRPGFYPAPVAYEGYYRPPMGYRNSNEREIPFMGMVAGPPAYNRYSGQSAHDPGNSHGRSRACGPNGKVLASEQVEPGRALNAQGPYRVLLKQQDGWDGKDEAQKEEDPAVANALNVEKGYQPKVSSWENEWRRAYRKDEQGLKRKAFGDEASYQVSDLEGGLSFVPVKVKSGESRGNANGEDNISAKKVEQAATTSPEVAGYPKDSSLIQKIEGLNAKVEDDISSKKVEQATTISPEFPACPKDSSLIRKIEGLNAKKRASDGRHDLISVSNREEPKNISQVVNADSDEAASGSVYVGKNYTSGINNHTASDGGVTARGKSFKTTAASGTVISRGATHGMHSRGDHDDKGVMSAVHSERSNIHVPDYLAKEVSGKAALYPQGKDGGDFVQHMFESSASDELHAKMRERVKQRQKEEEEHARDQKAKALAKLEELNRRTQAAENLTQKLDVLPAAAIQNKQEDHQSMTESIVAASKPGRSSSALVSNSNDAAQISERETSTVEKFTLLSNEQPLERPKSANKEFVGMHKHNESMPMKQHRNNDADVHSSNAPNVNDASASKQKHLSYKQKLNIPLERNSEKFITASTTDTLKVHADLTVSAASSREVVASEVAPGSESRSTVNSDVMAESIQQRRRNNRNVEKHKLQDARSGATLQFVVSTEANLVNSTSGEGGKTKASKSELDRGSLQSLTDSKDANQSLKQRLSSPSEENHFRENNQWKSQHSRRIPQNLQINKTAEKLHTSEAVIWAPVLTRTKAEVTGEGSLKPVAEPSSVKSDNQVQNSSRNKRVEMQRYVPKPVAKEMAQQGNSQQQLVAPSVDTTMSDEIDGKADTGSQAVESSQPTGFANGKKVAAMESKTGERDSRQNRQAKVHGSWRQRALSETTIVQGLKGSECSNASRNVQKSIEHQQTQKPDVSSVKEWPKYSYEWSSDGWTMPENSESSVPLVAPVVKDQGLAARGKRHQFKGQKGTGNSYDHDHKKISGDSDKIYVQPSIPVLETNQTDLLVSAKENRAIGDQSTSHWQPKLKSFLTAAQRASWSDSGQSVGAEIGRSNKMDAIPQRGVPIPHQSDKETVGGMSQPRHGHCTPQTSKMQESSNVGSQEPKKERKIAYVKGRPNSPEQGPGSLVDTAPPSNVDIRLDQHVPTGFRRNGNRNSRLSRVHESRGDWSSLSGKESKQHNQRVQKHNSHYEYQPVGPYDNHRSNYFEESKDTRNNAGGKDRERGQNHSRHGGANYHGRPSGTIRADGDCG